MCIIIIINFDMKIKKITIQDDKNNFINMNDIMNLTKKLKPTKSSLDTLANELTKKEKKRILKLHNKTTIK